MTSEIQQGACLALQSEDHPRNSEAAVVALGNGHLLAAWSEYLGGATDWSGARISARVSSDRGRTWDSPYVLMPKLGDVHTASPSLLRLHSGDLGLAFSVKNGKHDNRAFWCISADDGKTWSERTAITPDVAYHVLNNDRIVQLETGRLIAPIAYAPRYVDATTPFRSFCAVSDDDGRTWSRGSGEVMLPKRGAMEPGVVERSDGSVLMFIRTQLGTAYRALSKDGGEQWDDVRPLGPVSSESPISIKRIPKTGDLLMVWSHVWDPYKSHWGRSPLTAATSTDDGDTWQGYRSIESDPDSSYGYCSISFVDDEVLLTYYRSTNLGENDTLGIDLKLKITSVDWFYHSEVTWKTPGAAPFEKGL